MSETPPFPDLCYCYHRRGFALASMRNPMLSRYYIQCDLDRLLHPLETEHPEHAHARVEPGYGVQSNFLVLFSLAMGPRELFERVR